MAYKKTGDDLEFTMGDENEPLLVSDPQKRYVPKKYYTGADDLNTITETEEEKSGSIPGSKRSSWSILHPVPVSWHQKVGISSPAIAILLSAILTMVSLGGAILLLPMYLNSMVRMGSDTYTAILLASMWPPVASMVFLGVSSLVRPKNVRTMPKIPTVYLLGVGLLFGICLVVLSQAAPPWRTHCVMHPVQMTSVLPVAALLTTFLTNRRLNTGLYISLIAQSAGVFLSLFPLIFGFARGREFPDTPWHFTLLYILAWCLIACVFVTLSKLIKTYEDNILTVISWTLLFAFAGVALMFWTNLLPGFGMASGFPDFSEHFAQGVRCFYLVEHGCSSSVAPRAIAFIIFLWLGTMSILLLTTFTKGLTYLGSVLILVSPITTIFWTLFHDWPIFVFHPRYDDKSTIFVVSGLAVVVIGIICFIYVDISSWQSRQATSPRIRRQSSRIHIGRRELFPALQRRRRSTYAAGEVLSSTPPQSFPALRKVNSGPNLRLLSAASVAAATRGYSSFSSRGSTSVSNPVPVPGRQRQGLPRPKSSPHLVSI